MPTAPKMFRPSGQQAARQASERRYANTAQRKEAHSFYQSARWRRLRAVVLSEEPLCVECERHGRTELATQVDHVLPRREYPELAWDRGNLQPLCDACHARKTASGS